MLCATVCLRAGTDDWISAGPFGGNAEVVVASASDPNVLFAGTKNATIFLSKNAGETWEALSFPRQYSSMLHTLVIDPRNPAVVYAAIADEPRTGLYRSADFGHTWKPLNGIGSEEVYSLAFFNQDPQTMVAGLRQSVQVTHDGGATWKAISTLENPDMQPVVSVAFDPSDINTIYAGTPRLPWKTVDGGANWNLIAEGMSTDSDIITVRVDSSKPSRVFIGACSGFWHSNNHGELWSKMAGIPFTSRRTYAFVQNPEHPETIFAGTSRGLYRTVDGGAAWKLIAPYEIKSLSMSAGQLYIATADAGLFKSSDGGVTLKSIDTGFTSRNFSRVAEAGEHLYAGTGFEQDAGAVFVSADGGLHWDRISEPAQLGSENVLAIARSPKGTLVAATSGSLLRSVDAGKTWVRLKVSPPRVTSLISVHQGFLAGTESGIFRSSDDASSWKQVITSASTTKEAIHGLLRGGSIIAVLAHGMLVSQDDGETWSRRHLPFFTEVYDVAAAGQSMIAGTSRGLFRSVDAGQTWEAAQSGLPPASITAVAIDPVSPTRAFAFEYGNLYESHDAGLHWQKDTSTGLAGAFIRSFEIPSQGPHNLIAVTATRGIFVRPIDSRPTDGGKLTQTDFSAPGAKAGTRADTRVDSKVDTRKDLYDPNQQNGKTPAL